MTTEVNFSLIDHSNEVGSFTLHFGDVLADGSNYKQMTGDNATAVPIEQPAVLRVALAPLLMGNYKQTAVVVRRTDYDPTPPSSKFAQRETRMLMRYRDAVTHKIHSFQACTFNLNKLQTNEDKLDKSDTEVLAFIAAFELYVKAPVTGNAVQFLEGILME